MEDKVITISSCNRHNVYDSYKHLEAETAGKYAIVGVIIMIISVLAVSLLTPVNMLIIFKELTPFAVVSLLIWGSIAFTQKVIK